VAHHFPGATTRRGGRSTLGLPLPRGHGSPRSSRDRRSLEVALAGQLAPAAFSGSQLAGDSRAPPPPGCGSSGSSGPTQPHRSSCPERKEQRRKQACGSDNLCGRRPCAAVCGSMKYAVELTEHSKTHGRRYTQHCVPNACNPSNGVVVPASAAGCRRRVESKEGR
jgi:hypothetical protein